MPSERCQEIADDNVAEIRAQHVLFEIANNAAHAVEPEGCGCHSPARCRGNRDDIVGKGTESPFARIRIVDESRHHDCVEFPDHRLRQCGGARSASRHGNDNSRFRKRVVGLKKAIEIVPLECRSALERAIELRVFIAKGGSCDATRNEKYSEEQEDSNAV